MLKKIASFTINHDTLTPGMYVSRIDGDCVTYDLRLKFPNQGDGLPDGVLSHPPRQHEQGGRFAACARRIPFRGGF